MNRLWVRPAVILVVVTAYLVWLTMAPLSETEAATLTGGELARLTGEHLALTFTAAAIVLVIAIPLGIALTRGVVRRIARPVEVIANIGQAAPAVGIVVLMAFWLGFSFRAAVAALVVYAILPVLRNTIVGLQGVDPAVVEAARGLGMSAPRTLVRVELALAAPVVLAGVRTALVLLVGTATLAVFVNGGGLGLLITTGVNLFLAPVLISGALLVALLALAIDWLGHLVEYAISPKAIR